MIRMARFATFAFLVFGCGALTASAAEQAASVEFFERKIRPVLAENCYECHNSVDKSKGGLALDYKTAMNAGGDSGAVFVAGDPDKSLLIQSIRHEIEDLEMPSKKPKLSDEVIADFAAWVKAGAPDPRLEKPTKEDLEKQVDWSSTMERRSKWWSFLPPRKSAVSAVADAAWNQNDIDRLVFTHMRAEGLAPEAIAEPETLVRRLHLVLTGLPPKPAVVTAFKNDPSEAAYLKLVDELMASKQYAERWGRYWLDWYRYAESHGSEGDPAIPYVKAYRSYVVRALHADIPYDQLVKEHLAGDLLPNPRINEALGINESAIGPAQFRLVPHGFGVTDAYAEQIAFTDNQIDVVGKAMIGQTISCARCHNHKFDPISQDDFHKFYGMMISSRPAVVHVDSPERQAISRKEIPVVKEALQAEMRRYWLTQVDAAVDALAALDFKGLQKEGKNAPKGSLQELPKLVNTGNHPFSAIAKLKDVKEKQYPRMIEGWAKSVETRMEKRQETIAKASFYADLRDQQTYDKWAKSGLGISGKVSPTGSFAIAESGDLAVLGVYPRGVYSHMISTKLGGAISSPFHEAKGGTGMIRAQGNGAAVRMSVRNYPLSHGGLHPAPSVSPAPSWYRMGKYKYWNGDQVYFEACTNSDRTTRAKKERGWFGLTEVYAGDENLEDLGASIVRVVDNHDGVVDFKSLVALYRSALKDAVAAWGTEGMTDAQAEFLGAFVQYGFLNNNVSELPKKAQGLVAEYRRLDAAIPEPSRAPGVMEGVVWDQPSLTRGDYKKEADPVPRGFLDIFGGRAYDKTNSGRLALAEDMIDEKNTLLARVAVNRLWHHVFGRGIVASADNFGRLGKKPTHPELLDNLAIEFRETGWSMKRMVRQLVTSRTFRSSSLATRDHLNKDPENLYLSRFTPRRLDAEAILDSIKTVSGEIQADPSKDTKGRAVYVSMVRNRLNPFLTTFNLPIPTTTVGVRNSTDVPAQALTLMNDPIVMDAAKRWAQAVDRDPNLKAPAQKVKRLFMEGYGREPSVDELQACITYLTGKPQASEVPGLMANQSDLQQRISATERAVASMVDPVRERLLEQKQSDSGGQPSKPDFKPVADWRFGDGSSIDLIGGVRGKVLGKAKVDGGALQLDGGCFISEPLKKDIAAKTMEVVVSLANVNQRGGGALTVQNLTGDTFDSIVFAEAQSKKWLMGSNHFRRTQPLKGPDEANAVGEPVRIVVTQNQQGWVTCYRNGVKYDAPYLKGEPIKYRSGASQVVIGLRHGTAPNRGRALFGKVYEARLYDRALTPDEIAALGDGSGSGSVFVSNAEVLAELAPNQQAELKSLEQKLASWRSEKRESGCQAQSPIGYTAKRWHVFTRTWNLEYEGVYLCPLISKTLTSLWGEVTGAAEIS